MDASLVVVTHDSRADIVACLESVLEDAAAPGRLECIVVDNGSRDGTAALVRERFPQVRVVEQENLGFGAGNNRGAAEARGEVLVFLNPDTVAEPGFLRALLAAVRPGQAATAQIVLKQDPERLNTAGHRLHFTGYGFVFLYQERRLPPSAPFPAHGVSGACFAVRRDDYLRLGGFDPDFFLYMEDTELSWRMHRAGMRIVVAPAAAVAHDYVLEVPARKIAWLEEGRLLLLRKHLPWHLWLAYLPSLGAAAAISWARAAMNGGPGLAAKWRSYRRGFRRGIKRYPDLPRTRPHLFTSRIIPFGVLSRSVAVRAAGALVNGLYLANTLVWPLRRRDPWRAKD